MKTIAAFANKTGGCIVFGVADKPRLLVGIGGNELDEGVQSEQVSQAISPMPITHFFTIQLHGRILGVLMVEPLPKPPSIAIRDIQGGQGEDPVLRKRHRLHSPTRANRSNHGRRVFAAPDFA
ncbi:ATP-binding protein [Paracoccus sp. (in: a-proteobacteria)]|uniref:ATP-binding protein n=1 Tax=Paracoccus sp. TaxID=267 RepID=UPI003A4C55D6